MIYARFLAKAQGCLRLRSLLVRQCLAELLGVFVLIMITISASAQTVTSEGKKGGYISSALASGVSVMVAIHISGGVSGGHLNPAFSLCMCLLNQCPWWKLPVYSVFQILGAFLGSATVYALYYDAIHHYSNGTLTVTGPRETASIFATYPAPYLSLRNGFLDQVLGTGILVVSILALIDSRNKSMAKGMEPLGVGLLVLSLSLAMGANCSCAINPARDLGPRLFTYVAGWGPQVFSAGNYWWWVPIVAPMVGSATGTAVYQLCVAFHHPPDEDDAFSLPATEKDHRGTEKDIDIPIFAVNKYVDTWMEGNSVVVPATEHVKRETAPSP
ncbi:aquaporin-10 isoform X1 [Eublepharis macularius]|uniref:Aquaporin-10 isoform X1 n=1 Tax=Eublepharis macularius TaxID=481883 RepID=A0AA97L2H6_EUBMA|nr:aquaporin-10 isoform X1 [Eublepharis macularius]